MTFNAETAFFLWVGSDLPDLARISVLSAAEAGFETVLFSDRNQALQHPKVRQVDYREIDLPWKPEEVLLRGRSTPYFAGFANLFRYRLLSLHTGWWFDCDTIIVKPAKEFSKLLVRDTVVLGYEDETVVNNAVIGSNKPSEMEALYQAAKRYYPVFDTWGITGPKLLTELWHGEWDRKRLEAVNQH